MIGWAGECLCGERVIDNIYEALRERERYLYCWDERRVCRFIDYKLVNNIDDPVAKSKKGERKWVNDQIKSKSTAQVQKANQS